MRPDERVTITWPWLVATVAGGFLGMWAVDELTGFSWLSYAAFVVGAGPVLLTFVLTRK
jgi:hypothetical protein